MQQQQKIHVKLQHNNEFRRFIIEPQTNFNDLKQKISELLHLTSPITIRYLDEESEWITIDSDTELLTGIELSPALLRLQIVAQIPSTIPTELPNPVVDDCKRKRRCKRFREDNDDTVSEEKGCKKWKKHCRKFRDEKDDTVSEEKDCKKWRKHCRKFREEKDCDGEKDTESGEKKCRGKWRKWREEQCKDTESGEKKCGKWRKWREEHCDKDTESGEKKCGKWRKWRQENTEEGSERRPHCRRGGWGGPRGRHAWKHFENSDSDSLEETRPVEEIKKEINSLKEEIGVLVTKKKGLWEELVALKTNIKTLRQNEGARDEIITIRDQICEKRRSARVLHAQIANSKHRIWKLKSALVMRLE